MSNVHIQSKIIIAGPCAAESREQIEATANKIKKRKGLIMRAPLWKPRTKPGFEGVGEKGLEWLVSALNQGVPIATEVILPKHVDIILDKISGIKNPNVILWIGSRNQCHILQREIAKKIHEKAPKSVRLMIKNQPWRDEAHWTGIVEHVLGSGLEKDRIILCHRGFCPDLQPNPAGLRNIPDFEMAMRVKTMTNLPMLLDPSHIGGSVENVLKIIKAGIKVDFDGMIIEVHPEPKDALTDAKQQLTWEELDKSGVLI